MKRKKDVIRELTFVPSEDVVEEIKWNGKDRVEFRFDDGSCWARAKRQDFWNPDVWEKIIKKGTKIRQWFIGFALVGGFEVWVDGKWVLTWCAADKIDAKEIMEKRLDALGGYSGFIKNEAEKIAKLIDEGKSLKSIDKLVSHEHTANTYGWALNLGISNAENQTSAERIRKEHNAKYWWGEIEGVVKPTSFASEWKKVRQTSLTENQSNLFKESDHTQKTH